MNSPVNQPHSNPPLSKVHHQDLEAKQEKVPENLFEAKLEYLEAFMKVFGYDGENPETQASYHTIQHLKDRYDVAIMPPSDKADLQKICQELNQELRKVNAYAVCKLNPELKNVEQGKLANIIKVLVKERIQNPKFEIKSFLSDRDVAQVDTALWKEVSSVIDDIRKIEKENDLPELSQVPGDQQENTRAQKVHSKAVGVVRVLSEEQIQKMENADNQLDLDLIVDVPDNAKPELHAAEEKLSELAELAEAYNQESDVFGLDNLRAELEIAIMPPEDNVALKGVEEKLELVSNSLAIATALKEAREIAEKDNDFLDLEAATINACAGVALEKGGAETLRALKHLMSTEKFDMHQLLETARAVCHSNVIARCTQQEDGALEELKSFKDEILHLAKPDSEAPEDISARKSIDYLLTTFTESAEDLKKTAQKKLDEENKVRTTFNDEFAWIVFDSNQPLSMLSASQVEKRTKKLIAFLSVPNNYDPLYSQRDHAEKVKTTLKGHLKELRKWGKTTLASDLEEAFKEGYGAGIDDSGVQFLRDCANGNLKEKEAAAILADTAFYMENRLHESFTVSGLGEGDQGSLANHAGGIGTNVTHILMNEVLTSPTDKKGARVYAALCLAQSASTEAGAYNMGMNITGACGHSSVENAIGEGYETSRKRRKYIRKHKGRYLGSYDPSDNNSKLRKLAAQGQATLPVPLALKDQTFAHDGNQGGARILGKGEVAERFFADYQPLKVKHPSYALVHHLESNPDEIDGDKNWEASQALKEANGIGAGWPART